MALLEVSGIDVFYGSIQALRSVSLGIEAGERVALLGANGAGKTTTLRAISGMLAPSAGTITFDGEAISGFPPFDVIERGIAHLPEGRELFPGLSVEENLRLGYWPKRSDKGAYKGKLEEMFDVFPRLKERLSQTAGTLSGGEQQMLGVARALMSSPRMLIVDELSLGLAPIVVQQLFEVLDRVAAQGTTLLIVEQFVHMALENTDRAYVLSRGEVVLEGPSEKLRSDPSLMAAYLGGDADEVVAAADHIEVDAPPAPPARASSPKQPAKRRPAAKKPRAKR